LRIRVVVEATTPKASVDALCDAGDECFDVRSLRNDRFVELRSCVVGQAMEHSVRGQDVEVRREPSAIAKSAG